MEQAIGAKQKIIYDDTCGLCRGFRKAAEKRDSQNVFEFIPGPKADPDDFSPYPMSRDISSCLTVFDKDGRLYRGAIAMGKIMIQLGGAWRAVGRLMSWPIIRNIANVGYRIVASQRHCLIRRSKGTRA